MTDDIVCDFCGARRPAWEFPMSGGDGAATSIGRMTVLATEPWAACDACADLMTPTVSVTSWTVQCGTARHRTWV
jgi:hypothetical protein